MEEKLGHVRAYKMHIQDVQADRALEHTLQSENIMEGSAVLLLQTDGMDQAKWALPRPGQPRLSKQAASVVRHLALNLTVCLEFLRIRFAHEIKGRQLRPKMKVQGLWMQSIGLMLFCADVHMAHDSSMTVEAALCAVKLLDCKLHGPVGLCLSRR